MKTWLSGMSPVAADVASAWSALAEGIVGGAAALDVVGAAEVAGAAAFLPPHPASTKAAPTAALEVIKSRGLTPITDMLRAGA
jgi:hypothetical protein